jgi:hypothetical protein
VLVPNGSYAFRIGGRLSGGGAWLTWNVPPARADRVTTTEPSIDVQALIALAAKLVSAGQDKIDEVVAKIDLTSAETAMLGFLLSAEQQVDRTRNLVTAIDRQGVLGSVYALRQVVMTPELVKDTISSARASVEKLGPILGLPYAATTQAASGLLAKVGPEFEGAISRFGASVASGARTATKAFSGASSWLGRGD